ncbi:P-loop containing nucleoside triphosphate hydrolase [Purpureocillium lilacinum]|uniref:p-loop containing nucleoside triphosphate hydrolase n=1 Tax=Purpureocillium lilacinum TaxID=33203 RepID=A0A179GDE7_PURLI|nr:P-loop containing nucleoside triphosphate hydrolase [Purpureocillium lilacinum]
MDPLTAFSVFCNIITTVEAAVKTGKELKQLYDAASGLTGNHERVERSAAQLRKIAGELDTARRTLPSGSQQQPLFVDIAKECKDVTDKIDAILVECRVDGRGPKLVAVFKATVRTRRRRSELDRLLSEMESATKSLQISIAVASQADVETLKDQVYKCGVQQSELVERLSSISNDLTTQKDLLANVQRLAAAFDEGQTIRTTPVKDRKPDVGFVKWLTEGSGVYHVAGKPGSGKSTLMKFLANEPVVRSHLEKWAASAGKKLVLAKFFFWKYGSDDQKSVRGLLRGLLYGISRDSPCLTKALFPPLWGDVKSWRLPEARELTLNSSDIAAAFDKLRTDEGIRQQFRVCLFIDGLDEFDGKDMSYSSLAKQVRTWTDSPESGSFIKACVSSREEHPIMSAFPAPQRIHLQDLTRKDISALVRGTLEGCEPFLTLYKDDQVATENLVVSIVDDAQGVFLWVVLLLNLLEDELYSGISSISALQNIVRSAPKELEEFLGQILESIPNHHQHGAYFVLSMAIRMMGHHLSEKGSFDKAEQAVHEEVFRRPGPPLFDWYPYLPTYGVGKVLGEFEKRNHSFDTWSWPTWVTTQEYMDEARKATDKIRSWCRGLLDVPDPRLLEAGPLRCLTVEFAHRSIPEFLAAAMPTHAHKFGFDDDDVARAILAVTIVETLSTDELCKNTEVVPFSCWVVLMWRDLRPVADFSAAIMGPLSILASQAGLFEYAQWKLSRDPEFKRNPKELFVGLRGLWWSSFLGQWSHSHSSLLRILLAASSQNGLRFPESHRETAEGLIFMTADCDIAWPQKLARRLGAGHVDVHRPEHHKVVWFWPAILSNLLIFFIRCVGAPARTFLWEAIEIWLEHGAAPPLDIQRGRPSPEELVAQRREWKATRAVSRAKQAERKAKRAALHLNPALSDGEVGDEWDTFGLVGSDEHWTLPDEDIFSRLPIIQSSTTRMAVDILDLQIYVNYFQVAPVGRLVPHLETTGYITFADLVRYHNPPNAKALLGYIDRSQVLLEENASLNGDRVFTPDVINVARIEASKRHVGKRQREELARDRADGLACADSP